MEQETCPDCGGRGRRNQFIMKSFKDKKPIFFDFLICWTCRGTGKVDRKVAKHGRR